MEVELAHLRTLAEIARQRSFSRAGDRLHLSQPAVSHHIRHLEAAVGVPGFSGSAAWSAARVRIGTGATASIYLLPGLLRQFRLQTPDVELVVVTGNAPDIAAGVIRGELDVGIVTLPVSERRLHVTPFTRDPLVAITPPAREWRARRALSAVDLAPHPVILYERGGLIRKVIDGWFRAARVRPRIAMELGNAEAIKEMVAAGLGISITSAITVSADVRRRSLLSIPLSPPLERDLGIIRRRGKSTTPALSAVISALESFAPLRPHR